MSKKRKKKKSQYNWDSVAIEAIVQLIIGIMLILIEKII